MATQKQRSESTRQKLLDAFRASFLAQGYEATTTQQILVETGLSKGALYHHFRSKSDVMEALYEFESHTAIERAMQDVDRSPSPLSRLKASYLAWLKTVRPPSVARILFEIGPSALGERRSKEIEAAASIPPIMRLLQMAKDAGEIAPPDDDLLISLLNALVADAALYQLHTGIDPTETLDRSFSAIFESMKP